MQCPNCGQYDPDNHEICPNCQHPITSHSNPYYDFLRNNFAFFAIVGFFGTMLALLPNLLEKLKDGIWIGSLGANGMVLFVCLILIIVFLIILTIFFIYEITLQKFNLPVIIFSFIFLLFLFGFIVILNNMMSIFVWYNRLLYSILLYWVMAFIFVIAAFLLRRTISAPNAIVRVAFIIMIFVGCFIFWVFILQIYDQSTVSQRDQSMINFPQSIEIKTESDFFNPRISSSIGLGIMPSNISDKLSDDLNQYTFQWNSDYGYFVKWLPSEQRTVYLSNNTTQFGSDAKNNILWTYNREDLMKMKDNVTINLMIKNTTSGYTLKRKLNLNWIDVDIAHVEMNTKNNLDGTIPSLNRTPTKNIHSNIEKQPTLFLPLGLPTNYKSNNFSS